MNSKPEATQKENQIDNSNPKAKEQEKDGSCLLF